MAEPTFPEHDKMSKVQGESQTIGQFLEWLQDHDIALCLWDDPRSEYVSFRDSIEKILASYFEIDLAKIEAEKQKMLEICRQAPS